MRRLAASGVLALGLMSTACSAGQYDLNQRINNTAPTTQPTSCHARHVVISDPQAWLPDPTCTPGALDGGIPAAQLCPVAHTKTVRPPASYTNALKHQQMAAYGFTDSPSVYEEDHLISLELGGSPRDPLNLWPEPHQSPNEKDRVETAAHEAICSGKLTTLQVQQRIANDWHQLGIDLDVIH